MSRTDRPARTSCARGSPYARTLEDAMRFFRKNCGARRFAGANSQRYSAWRHPMQTPEPRRHAGVLPFLPSRTDPWNLSILAAWRGQKAPLSPDLRAWGRWPPAAMLWRHATKARARAPNRKPRLRKPERQRLPWWWCAWSCDLCEPDRKQYVASLPSVVQYFSRAR